MTNNHPNHKMRKNFKAKIRFDKKNSRNDYY